MSDTVTTDLDAGPAARPAAGSTPAAPTGGGTCWSGWTPPAVRVRTERYLLWASAVLAVAVPATAAGDAVFPGREALALLFLLFVPGVPAVSLLRVRHPLVAATLAGATSISCALLTATAAITLRAWDPVAWTAGIAVVGLVVTGLALRRLPRLERTTAPRAGAGTTPSRWVARLVSSALLVAAGVSWWLVTRTVDLDATGAVGVIGVLGWPYFLALGLVVLVGTWHLLRPRPDQWVLAATAIVLCLVLFGTVNVAEGQGSVATGWLHVGFTRFITEHHVSFTGLDARASWPGFFAASAQLVRLTGVPDASAFLVWAPVVYNVAAIAPLLVIARVVTRSRRLAWLAVFVYLASNWFQQDYFSPQATALLLYLAVFATMLWTASTTRDLGPRERLLAQLTRSWRRRPGLPVGTGPAQSLAMEGLLFVISAAVVVAHQLTPVYLVLTLLLFTITGRTRYRRLWLVVAMLFLTWFSYGATDFWAGHLKTVFGDLGQLGSNLNSGVAARVTGDPTYQLMQDLRVLYSLLLVLLAATGLWLIRRRRDVLLLALVPAAAAVLVALQSYGGEVVLRVFVYSSPVLAPLAALALRRLVRAGMPVATRRRHSARQRTGRPVHVTAAAALFVVLAAYGLLGTTTRGVNTSFERVTDDDVAAAQALWSNVHHGDTVGYLAPAGAYNGAHVGDWTIINLDPSACGATPFICARDTAPRFVLLSRTQDAEESLVASAGPGTATRLGDDLVNGGLYRVLYKGQDAELLVRVDKGD